MLSFTTLDRRNGATCPVPNIALYFQAKDLNFCLFRPQSFHQKVFSLVTWLQVKADVTQCWLFFPSHFPRGKSVKCLKIADAWEVSSVAAKLLKFCLCNSWSLGHFSDSLPSCLVARFVRKARQYQASVIFMPFWAPSKTCSTLQHLKVSQTAHQSSWGHDGSDLLL